MMMGEAVVSFRPEITENLQYFRKQSAQLASNCVIFPVSLFLIWKMTCGWKTHGKQIVVLIAWLKL